MWVNILGVSKTFMGMKVFGVASFLGLFIFRVINFFRSKIFWGSKYLGGTNLGDQKTFREINISRFNKLWA